MAEEKIQPTEKKAEEMKDEKNAAGADESENINEQKAQSDESGDKQQVSEIKTEETPKTEPLQTKPEVAEKKSERAPEKEYVIPIRNKLVSVPRYKKTNKAVRIVKEFLVRHMKVYDRDLNKIKIDKHLNEFLWFRGIRKPPAKVKVKVVRDGEKIRAELSDLPERIKFKKARLDKREQKAMEFVEKKKKTLAERLQAGKAGEKLEEKVSEKAQTEEEKKEEKEKAKAGEEAMQKLEKAAAKQTKHQTKVSKQPKRQQRKALAK